MIDSSRGPWITVADGSIFYLLDPRVGDFNLVDVASALSRICRFGGHIGDKYENDIYSVAQHSVYVERSIRNFEVLHEDVTKVRQAAILHDGPESVYHDMATPLKDVLHEYQSIEKHGTKIFANQFDVACDGDIYSHVHRADKFIGCLEAQEFQPEGFKLWNANVGGWTIWDIDPNFRCWGPKEAKQKFLERCEELDLI